MKLQNLHTETIQFDPDEALPDEDNFDEDLVNWYEKARYLANEFNQHNIRISNDTITISNIYGHGTLRTYALVGDTLPGPANNQLTPKDYTRYVAVRTQNFEHADTSWDALDPRTQTVNVGGGYGIQLKDDGEGNEVWVGPIDI